VATKNDVRVNQAATDEYAIHQYKDFVGGAFRADLEWEGQTDIDCSISTVYLQIFNHLPPGWENIDSNNSAPANVDFILSGHIADLAAYKNASNVISCRILQDAK